MTAEDIIKNALMEIGIIAQGETPSADDANFGLSKLNDLIDEWAARKIYAYNLAFNLYTLTPNLQPHTIGPTGATLSATQRPIRVESAQLVLNTSTPNTDLPLNIRDDDWWAAQRVKSLTSTIPTDLYYSADWPNGSIYLWPIPTTAYGLRLETWGLLSQFATLVTAFSLPPGYRKAITLSLAEDLAGPFQVQVSAMLASKAQGARKAIQGNNSPSPRIQTSDFGMPKSGGRGDFNYLTGGPSK